MKTLVYFSGLAIAFGLLGSIAFAEPKPAPPFVEALKKDLCAASVLPAAQLEVSEESCVDSALENSSPSLKALAAAVETAAQKLLQEEIDRDELKFFHLMRSKNNTPEMNYIKYQGKLEVSALEKQVTLSPELVEELKPPLRRTFGAQDFTGIDLPKLLPGIKQVQAMVDARYKAAKERLEKTPLKYQVNSSMEKAMERYAEQSKDIEKAINQGVNGKGYYLYEIYEILSRMDKYVLDEERTSDTLEKLRELEKDYPESKPTSDSRNTDREELQKFRAESYYDGEKYDEERSKKPEFCGLSAAEIRSISDYTGQGYKALNRILNDEPVPGEKRETYLAYRNVLNRALSKLKPYKGTVTRTAFFRDEVLAQHQEGSVVTYPAFTSTALTLGQRTGYDFVIQSKRGRYVGTFSPNDDENEVLFPAGSKFKVVKVDKRSKGNITFTLEEVE